MLTRILETEVMHSQAEAIAYDDMDHASVNRTFVDDLLAADRLRENLFGTERSSGDQDVFEVLDVGTGTARIPLLLCDVNESLRVLAVDLSEGMLDIARINIELSRHAERIMLGRCDAKQLDLKSDRFDVVLSNSIVHHIPEPATTFAEAVRVCKPGGLLFFRDLLRPDNVADVQQLVETYAGDESDHARQMFDDSLRAALTLEEVQRYVCDLGFAAENVVVTSDRHWTWCATKSANISDV